MGNEQSTQKKRQKANAEKKVQNGELNGHAVAAPDGTEPETSKEAAVDQKSEAPPAPVTNEPKPPEKEEVDSSKANGPVHVETTPEQKTTKSTDAEPPKKAAKPSGDEMSSFLGKMFKKKSEPVKPAAENNDSVDAPVKAVDLKIDMQPDKVFINTDQKEILEEVAEKIKLQLVDSIPVQPISSGLLTKHVPLESSNTNEILLAWPATQEPVAVAEKPIAEEPFKRKASELHIGHLKSEEEPLVDAKAAEDEEPKTEDAVKALKEDKELIQLVESIISEEKEQACENEPNGTKQISDDADSVSSVVKLAVDTVDAEEAVIGAEEPLLVAEEIADIVDEILHISQEQESLDAEESEEHQRNKCQETLVVTEESLPLSVEAALIAEEEIAPATSKFILAVNGSATVDEESWVIIEEPARPLNISGLLEEPAFSRSKCYSADSSQLLSRLRSACTKVLEDASCKPLSVNVCADESTIHITVELCPDEFTCLNKDPVDIKTSTEPEPKTEALEPSPVEAAEENNPSEEAEAVDKTVMNFFKTFVTPTKTSKEAKATPDASKEQSQKETPPAPSTNVQEAPKAPPPPPAPPKMESKAEPAVKKEDTSATKATAAAATKTEGSAKSKTKDSALSKLFRSKADASKTSTLEAAAKPEEPPAPKPEEKKLEKKSTFGSMFKPKVLLGQVSSRIQAAASSAAASISRMSAAAASEPKKETPAAPPMAEAAPAVKAKEEVKPATPAPQVAPDNKSAESTDNASPNMPRKLRRGTPSSCSSKTWAKNAILMPECKRSLWHPRRPNKTPPLF
ncbi:flocculation protein FLO11-like isoform X4 [Cyprinus carpio]|uniref:Flocculation protein FLO11-like isoform X4 n=1 Tax=Cyprinus carpio TaxID=7962 RepID=A0A9Q9VR09_CYPCA|nr:flocculation protein FLO11-like isoform X4 [Cyprinus carpio]